MAKMRIRRRLWSAFLVLVAVAGAACSSRSSNIGAGDDVDLCTAVRYLNRFTEPRPESKSEVLDYATGFVRVIDRVDKRRELAAREELTSQGREPKASPKALADIEVIKVSMEQLRDTVKAIPDDGDAVRAATNKLAANTRYAAAERRITAYYSATCEVE